MSRKKRVVITFVVVELSLAALWYWMFLKRSTQDSHPGSLTFSNDAATGEALAVIGSTMTTAMFAVGGFFIILFVLAAKNDRENPRS
jgi:hypothetical protein